MKRVEDFNGGCRSNRKEVFFGAVVCLAAFEKKIATFSFFSRVENMDFMFLCVFIVIIA